VKKSDFSFDLPSGLIAQTPVDPRDSSRLLVVDRKGGTLTDACFRDLPDYLNPGDVLVLNDTRVVPARIRGRKKTGGKVELLLLTREAENVWSALVKASKRPKPGTVIELDNGVSVEVAEARGEGVFAVNVMGGEEDALKKLEEVGEIPLPPYIRGGTAGPSDKEWYQTVFADEKKSGSAAAPTAGLHFTERLLTRLVEKNGVKLARVTLHVGLGTFLPMRAEKLKDHAMHSEWFDVSEETAKIINDCLDRGRRVAAVGTTATRVLEHQGKSGRIAAGSGWTDIFITPGHEFKIISGLLTNFHLPESTLLVLACAFGGTDRILDAYRHAVDRRYRFYSYGDAMLIL